MRGSKDVSMKGRVKRKERKNVDVRRRDKEREGSLF